MTPAQIARGGSTDGHRTATPEQLSRCVRSCYSGAMFSYVTASAEARPSRDGTIKLHGPEGFAGMRTAGRLSAEILES